MQLRELHVRLWHMLEHAVDDATHGFHTGVLANGSDARTVVLRAALREPPQVLIYSDRRAPKVAQLQDQSRATLVLYAKPCQLRLRGTVSIHLDDALADTHWVRCPLSSRRAYLASAPPGSVLATPGSGLAEGLDSRAPTLEESLPGRAHFAVLRLAIEEIDCLLLEPGGHRRAGFWADGGAEWRVP